MPHHCEICEKHQNHLGCQTVCCRVPTHAVIGWQGYGGKGGVRPSHSAAAQWQQAVAVCLHLFSTWSGNCPLLGKQYSFFGRWEAERLYCLHVAHASRCGLFLLYVFIGSDVWMRHWQWWSSKANCSLPQRSSGFKIEKSPCGFAHNAVCLFIRDAKYQAGLRWLRLNGGWMVTGFWSIGCTFF